MGLSLSRLVGIIDIAFHPVMEYHLGISRVDGEDRAMQWCWEYRIDVWR